MGVVTDKNIIHSHGSRKMTTDVRKSKLILTLDGIF